MEISAIIRFRERSARLLLFLTLIHTIPVLWLTPVSGGTAPISALLAFGIASLFTFDAEGIGLGMFALLPALVYTVIAWVLAWLISRLTARRHHPIHLALLTVIVAVPFAAVYFPIYTAGDHNSSSNANLFELFSPYLTQTIAVFYWIILHAVALVLLAIQYIGEDTTAFNFIRRWLKPGLGGLSITLLGAIVYTHYATVLCRPLAELGNNTAQICVAKHNRVEARYWYERAAQDGNAEAIKWLVTNTPNQRQRLAWLRQGASAGFPEMQYQLAKHLQRWGDGANPAEAIRWLNAAAAGNHGPAQMELAEQMTAEIMRTASRDQLAQRNALLEQAASNGSRLARLRLAEHYTRGSMGYPIDSGRARRYYQDLAATEAVSSEEQALRINSETYLLRLQQLDDWQAGLDANDPQVMKALAKLYIGSQLPGPGVHEYGLQLFEQVAAGDTSTRSELIVMLRTGTGGFEKDLSAAKKWLLRAAETGDLTAMDRVASNYMKGREGFSVDYPKAQFWIEALITHYRQANDKDAPARIAGLEAHLKHFERLSEQAGGALLGEKELNALAQKSDAASRYQFALQLMAGQAARRTEAVEHLQAAADLGYGDAAWRLVQVYERGFPAEIDPKAARRELERAAQHHHFDATKELAQRYEYGKKGYGQNLPLAIEMYEAALAAGNDNRYNWNLDPHNFYHFRWLESRLHQAKLKLNAELAQTTGQK
jgi:TPR repeat protein